MRILMFLISLLLCATTYSEDYKPFVKIVSADKLNEDHYSGFIISDDKNSFTVLTCWHGIEDLNKDNMKTIVELMPSSNNNESKPHSYYALYLKSDQSRDLSLWKIKKLPNIKVKVLKIVDERVKLGEECKVYGFVPQHTTLSQSTVVIQSYTTWSNKNIDSLGKYREMYYLSAYGHCQLGVSGGPLVYKDKVAGVLSFRNIEEHIVAFCPHNEIKEFLNE